MQVHGASSANSFNRPTCLHCCVRTPIASTEASWFLKVRRAVAAHETQKGHPNTWIRVGGIRLSAMLEQSCSDADYFFLPADAWLLGVVAPGFALNGQVPARRQQRQQAVRQGCSEQMRCEQMRVPQQPLPARKAPSRFSFEDKACEWKKASAPPSFKGSEKAPRQLRKHPYLPVSSRITLRVLQPGEDFPGRGLRLRRFQRQAGESADVQVWSSSVLCSLIQAEPSRGGRAGPWWRKAPAAAWRPSWPREPMARAAACRPGYWSGVGLILDTRLRTRHCGSGSCSWQSKAGRGESFCTGAAAVLPLVFGLPCFSRSFLRPSRHHEHRCASVSPTFGAPRSQPGKLQGTSSPK